MISAPPAPLERISKTLGNPLHRQVFLVLRDRILSRRYLVGEMLPTEEELVKQFKVSRTTLRSALSELERAGLIVKRHGVGTFVAQQGSTEHVRGSISDMILQTEELDRLTTVEVVEVESGRVPWQVQDLFDSEEDDIFQRAIRIRRLHSGKPIACIRSYIPERIGRAIDPAAMAAQSLYALLAQSGSPVLSATQNITATLSEPGISLLMETEVGAPLLEIDRTLRGAGGRPVCYVEILLNPVFFKLQVDLTPMGDETRAAALTA